MWGVSLAGEIQVGTVKLARREASQILLWAFSFPQSTCTYGSERDLGKYVAVLKKTRPIPIVSGTFACLGRLDAFCDCKREHGE